MGFFKKSRVEHERESAERAMAEGCAPDSGYGIGMSLITTCALGEGMVSVSIKTEGRTVYLTMGPEQARHFAQLLADAAGTF
jgi:hypothetical protein